VSLWRKRSTPIIAYVMTSTQWKGRGIAASLLDETLHVLAAMGYTSVYAVITGGNEPSEKLFMRTGFKREDEPAASGD
jgi:RimJ/RimL family protein N-acetyltransferase